MFTMICISENILSLTYNNIYALIPAIGSYIFDILSYIKSDEISFIWVSVESYSTTKKHIILNNK